PIGQQLFVCNSSLNGWVLVNDDSALAASVTAETSRATTSETGLQNNINAEAAARAAADTTETNRAQGAEGTLTTNLNSEISNRTAAVTAEATARAAADTTLQN